MYTPIKYSHQKLDLNLQRFIANLAWKILNKHELKIPRFCQIWPKYWCKNQTISVFKLGNLILFYGNIINKLLQKFKLKIEPLPHPALPVSNLKCYYSSSNIRIYWKKNFFLIRIEIQQTIKYGKTNNCLIIFNICNQIVPSMKTLVSIVGTKLLQVCAGTLLQSHTRIEKPLLLT